MGKGGHFRKALPTEEEELRLKSYPDGPQNPAGISEAPQKQTRNLISCQYVSFNSLLGSNRIGGGGFFSSGNTLSDLDYFPGRWEVQGWEQDFQRRMLSQSQPRELGASPTSPAAAWEVVGRQSWEGGSPSLYPLRCPVTPATATLGSFPSVPSGEPKRKVL